MWILSVGRGHAVGRAGKLREKGVNIYPGSRQRSAGLGNKLQVEIEPRSARGNWRR